MAKKKEKKTQIQNWNETNNALRRMCEIEIAVSDIEGAMNLDINRIKEEVEKAVAPLAEEKKALEREVLNFAENRKAEFAKARTKKLTFGSVAFRIVQSVKYVAPAASIIKSLETFGHEECLKITKKIVKDELAKLDDIALAKVGAKKDTTDKPRIELNLEKVKQPTEEK